MSNESLDAPTTLDIDVAPGASLPTLYQHLERSQWGVGIVLRKEPDRIHVQFQDGRKRTFKKGYYHLFDAVDRRFDVASGIVDALRGMAGEKPARRSTRRPVSLDEQVRYFGELFEEGFDGEDYRAEHRGDGRKRPLKRHRDGLVELAQKELAKRPMLEALTNGDPSEVHAAAGRVVASTNLVAVKERKAFLDMAEEFHAPVANALFALLHGKSELMPRFDALVAWLERGMGQTPSWELVTVFLGSLKPKDHVVVRESVFSKQAAWMAPGLRLSTRPMGVLYERLLVMTAAVRDHLVEAGVTPRDNLDVRDFIWATLRPKAQRAIEDRRPEWRLEVDGAPAEERESDQAAA